MGPRYQCLICKDIIQSKHHRDFVQCKCKSIAVDGGATHGRVIGQEHRMKELLQYEWQRKGSLVYRLKETGRWRKGEPELTSEFWFKIDSHDGNLNHGKVEAEQLAQKLVDFLNRE